MKYKYVLTLIAIFIAFLLPIEVINLMPDGIKEIERTEPAEALQIKLEPKTIIDTIPEPKPTTQPVNVSGACIDWITSAGITDVANAMELIRRESNCNPQAVNQSSGACGIAQELPCGKSGCQLGDGPCQIKWMANYVYARYGSFTNAIAFHNNNGWY
jgi:hypothetical protein